MSGVMIVVILTGLLLIACAYDASRFIIPNWLNGLLVVLYPLWVWQAPHAVDWQSGLGFFAILLLTGIVLHMFKLFGAGDGKLLAACGLYCGITPAGFQLVLYMAILGGALALVLIVMRYLAPMLAPKLGCHTLPRLLTMGEPVPYGLAIAGSFLIMLWSARLPGMAAG